ncbi:hypothetical protein [Priestia aryabhattai]
MPNNTYKNITEEVKAALFQELTNRKEELTSELISEVEIKTYISKEYPFLLQAILMNYKVEEIFNGKFKDIKISNVSAYETNKEDYIKSYVNGLKVNKDETIKEFLLTMSALEEIKKDKSFTPIAKLFQLFRTELKSQNTVTVIKQDKTYQTLTKVIYIGTDSIGIGNSKGESKNYILVKDIIGIVHNGEEHSLL